MFRKKSAYAIIIAKRLTPKPTPQTQTAVRGWYFCYGFATVKFDDGKQRELEVNNKEIYNSLIEGSRGLLTYKGYNLLMFDRTK